MPYGELPCSATPLKADIRLVWIIWRKNYGILIDRDKYDVFYSGFASNFMPDITVNLHE